jgi:hypothetical protein
MVISFLPGIEGKLLNRSSHKQLFKMFAADGKLINILLFRSGNSCPSRP